MYTVANLYYFPPISYFHYVIQGDSLLIEANEHYQKRSFRNKCRILGPHGVEQLRIPLRKGKNSGLSIRDVQISYDENWAISHWRAIQTNYGAAPYFIHYADELKDIYDSKPEHLYTFSLTVLKFIIKALNINIELTTTVEFIRNHSGDSTDIRDNFKPYATRLTMSSYQQVFSHKLPFAPDLSILDLIMCQGPYASTYLTEMALSQPLHHNML